MAPLAIILFLTYLAGNSNGLAPKYAQIQTDLDQLGAKVKLRDEGYRKVFEKFDEKLDKVNTSLSADAIRIYSSLSTLEMELLQGQASSRLLLTGIGNHTEEQLDDLKGDTDKILIAISGLKDDYADFKNKTLSLWNMEANLSSIRAQLEENRERRDSEISGLKSEITNIMREEMVAVQTALASLLRDMFTLKSIFEDKDSKLDCPSTWSRFGNSCYRKMNQATTWKLARFICTQMDSFLVEMYTEDEINFIAELAGNDTASVWTGATIRDRAEWTWSESKSEVKFDLFSGDYPTGRRRAYCGLFVPDVMSLDDSRCGKKNPFICRKMVIH